MVKSEKGESSGSSGAPNTTNREQGGDGSGERVGDAAAGDPVNVLGDDPNLMGTVMVIALLAWVAEYMARSSCTC